jgi:hypothetical protein
MKRSASSVVFDEFQADRYFGSRSAFNSLLSFAPSSSPSTFMVFLRKLCPLRDGRFGAVLGAHSPVFDAEPCRAAG